jgi:hypothetical protein
LHGDDFAHVLHSRGPIDPERLPPYVEFVKRRHANAPRGSDLVQTSMEIFRRRLKHAPTANPFNAFKVRFARDLEWLATETLETFHRYSFSTLRQFGACFELAATYLHWLGQHDIKGLDEPLHAFRELSAGGKTIQFQLARAMTRKKPLDLAPIDQMATTWRTAIDQLTHFG